MSDVMLTTKDNPYDPFENFNEWLSYDIRLGYNTSSYLDRIVHTSPELYELYDSDVEEAIDEILEMNLTGNLVKVYRK